MNLVKALIAFLFMMPCMLLPDTATAQKKKQKKALARIYDLDSLINPVPRQRELFMYYVDNEQKKIDLKDGVQDGKVNLDGDEVYSKLVTDALILQVDQIQIMIENLPYKDSSWFYENNEKIGMHRALESILKKYNKDTKKDPVYYKKRVENFKEFVIAMNQKELEEFFKKEENIYTYENLDLLNGKHPELKKQLLMALGEKEPRLMISKFTEFAHEPYSGDVIAPAARVVPNEVFNFASSGNLKYSNAIKRSSDPLVQTIVKIASQSNKPLLALPFLGDIHTGSKTIAEIDKIVLDPDLFFKNLVRQKLEKQQIAGKTLTDELQYRINNRYIRKINELHDASDAVRFKILEGLSAEELYFIMIYGQDEIYTSSFLGANKRMLERMKPLQGHELLTKVNYDRFRTFIRMSAGYNTLGTFLETMELDNRMILMEAFVSNLENGRDDDLEDAVDVADAFGSINKPELAQFIKDKVKLGYERSVKARNPKGMKIYALLTSIFEGNEEELGLPPIKNLPYDKLAEDNGVVYERVFFYGDDDGKISFVSFMNNFRDGKWKVENEKYWTKISSTTGKPLTIYANLPLTEPQDEEAQNQLDKHLAAQNINPGIVVHRGHSYHLPTTLDHLNDKVRIVVLGSCGGYHNLSNVLDASPDAHIISSKQTGSMSVNDPIIRTMNDILLAGNDVNWVSCWNTLDTYFANKSLTEKKLYSDYIPPYKNLGAIFIKAYRKLSAQENL